MKMESMAQFLIKGDFILDGRKKYEVLNVSTTDENTKILIKDKAVKSMPLILLRIMIIHHPFYFHLYLREVIISLIVQPFLFRIYLCIHYTFLLL